MHRFEHLADQITEGRATDVILDAARANPDREPRVVRGYTVTFGIFTNGREYLASVRAEDGTCVATAVVDEFDI